MSFRGQAGASSLGGSAGRAPVQGVSLALGRAVRLHARHADADRRSELVGL